MAADHIVAPAGLYPPVQTRFLLNDDGTVFTHHGVLDNIGAFSANVAGRLSADECRQVALAYLAAAERSDAIRAERGE